MRTFDQMRTEVLRYFDLASEPSTSADVLLVGESLNANNALRATEDRWKFMLSSEYTLSVTAGTSEYILPHANVAKLQYLYSTTNNQFAVSVAARTIPYAEVGYRQSDGGASRFYEISYGVSPVAVQPTTAGVISITSSDVETPQVFVAGEDASGVDVEETITVGTPGAVTFAKVTYVAKVSEATGTLTISRGVTLLTLGPTEYGKAYPVVKFTNNPTQAETFVYKYFRNPRKMTRDYDTPDLPYPLSQVLVYDTLLDLATYNELDSESVNLWREKQQQALSTLYLQKLEGDIVAGSLEHQNDSRGLL